MSGINQHQINEQFVVSPITKWMRQTLMVSMIAATGMLTACGGSSSSETTSPVQTEQPRPTDNEQGEQSNQEEGSVMLAITDAEEDFVSYTIGINSILFTRENGDQVEVIADHTEIDFVEYQELTELFSIVKAPIGKYQSITMELDYSEAYILIQDEDGTTYEAQAVDPDGTLITTYSVTFSLAEDQALEIQSGRLKHLTLDLDLSASNTIESFDPAVVTVEPFVIGSVELDDEREHRVRGTVASADTEAQTLTLNIKPMRKKQGEFGEFVVEFDDSSTFEIDGEVLAIDAALANLANQGEDFAVVTYGTVTTDDETGDTTFVADQLLAGSSVPWAGKDVFKGMVTKLEEGVSYVSGLVIDTDNKERNHAVDIAFSSDETTTFNSRLDETLTADYLVPGQQLNALGQFEVESEVSSYNASGEAVQILLSSVMGQVTGVDDAGLVTIDVERLNKRPRKIVKRLETDFSLETVVADISSADLITVAEGDWVKVTGLFNPLTEVAESGADMQAYAIAKYEVSDSELKYGASYSNEGTVPVIDLDANTMTLDLTQGRHKLNFRFNPVNMLPEIEAMTIVSAEETGHFSLRQRGTDTQFFDTYAELLSAVASSLEAETVNSVAGKGLFDSETNTLTVTDLVVKLN